MREMKYIFGFLFIHILLWPEGYSSQVGTEMTDVLSSIVHDRYEEIAKLFEKEILKFRKAELRPNGSEVEYILEDSLTDLSYLKNHGSFLVARWDNKCILINANASSTTVYLLEFSNDKLDLSFLLNGTKPPLLQSVDFLKVAVTGNEAWIVEFSRATNFLLISAVHLSEDEHWSEWYKGRQFDEQIIDVVPFIRNKKFHLMTLAQSKNDSYVEDEEMFVLNLKFYSVEEDILNLDFATSITCTSSSPEITTFISNDIVYFIFNCFQNIHIYKLTVHKSLENIQEIFNTDGFYTVKYFSDDNKMYLLTVESGFAYIYNWFEDQFIKWNEFEISDEELVVDIFSYQFQIYILTTTVMDEVLLYSYVSNNLKLLGHYSLSCQPIKHFLFYSEEERLLLGILCNNMEIHLLSQIYHLPPEYKEELTDLQSDQPHGSQRIPKCIENLKAILEKRKKKIEHFLIRLDHELLLTDGKNQYINRPISFFTLRVDGKLGANSFDLHLGEDYEKYSRKIAELYNKVHFLSKRIKNFITKLPTLMTYGTDQHISLSIEVPRMLATSCNILSLQINELNEIPYYDYKTKYLLINDDQIIAAKFNFEKMITKNVNVKVLTDGRIFVPVKDLFDSNNPNIVVSGRHTFSTIEVLQNIYRYFQDVPMKINGININETITQFSNIIFHQPQTFLKPLRAKYNLEIENLNTMNFNSWQKSLIRIDPQYKSLLHESITVRGNVFVRGNIKTPLINGIDIWSLYESSLKKNVPHQTIKEGPISFKKPTTMKSITLYSINDISWADLLRLEDQAIKAQFYIQEGTVLDHLYSDSINNVDISKEALISGLDQKITGRITFTSDVDVIGPKGIFVDKGSSINGVNLTYLDYGYLNSDHIIVNESINFGKNLKISGNVYAQVINQMYFPDLENNFWRKSRSQNIPGNVVVAQASFYDSVFTYTWNSLPLGSYILKDAEQTIYGPCYFSEIHVLGNLEMSKGATISGFDISRVQDRAVSLHTQQSLSGDNLFKNGIIIDKLFINNGLLKNIALDDLLGKDSYAGPLNFSQVIVETLFLDGDLEVGYINGRPADDVIDKKPRPIRIIDGNLILDQLKVNTIELNGNLNDRNLSHWNSKTVSMQNRILKFTEPFKLVGNIQFTGSLNVDQMNGKPFNKYINQIVLACSGCRVFGKKIFTSPSVVVKDQLNALSINGISLNNLRARLFSRTREQNIRAQYTFGKGITGNFLQVPSISGIKVDSVAFTDSPIVFNNPIIISSRAVFDGDLISPQGWLSECNVDKLLNPPIIGASNLVNSEVKLGQLRIDGEIRIKSRFLFSPKMVDVIDFLSNVVTKSSNQDITVSPIFSGSVSIKSLYTNYVNEISVPEFFKKLDNTNIHIDSNCSLVLNNLKLKQLRTNYIRAKYLNGQEITVIDSHAVKKHQDFSVSGTKHFMSGAHISTNLQVERINEKEVYNIVKTSDTISYGEIKFLKSMTVFGDVKVGGLIAETDPDVLFKPFSYSKSDDHVEAFPAEYNSVIIEGNLFADSINGIELDDVLIKSAKSQIVTGRKIIRGSLVINGDADIEKLNGIVLNQFHGKINFNSSNSELSRYINSRPTHNSPLENLELLQKAVFKLSQLNLMNFNLAKGLHSKLFYITIEDVLWLQGILSLKMHGDGRFKNILAVLKDKECQQWSSCPCLSTFSYEVKNSKLEQGKYIKGLNIPIAFKYPRNYFYNFHFWCREKQVLLTADRIYYHNESRPVLNRFNNSIGNVIELLPFSHMKNVYFVALLKDLESNRFTVTVFSSNLKSLWYENFYFEIQKIDLKQYCFHWYLLVVTSDKHVDEIGATRISPLYLWNPANEEFKRVASFPSGSTGHLSTFRGNGYLFIGQKWQKALSKERHDLLAYKSVNCSSFRPFTSVKVNSVASVTTFSKNQNLYLLTGSEENDKITVHRLLENEGFEEIQSISVPNPTSIGHYIENDEHYLIVASNYKYIILLKLHFKGTELSGRE